MIPTALATMFLLGVTPAVASPAAARHAPVTPASPLTAPLAAFDKERWAEAAAGFERASVAGSGPAEAYLGLMAEYGLGRQRDDRAALDHYFEAGQRGDPFGALLFTLIANDTGLVDLATTHGRARRTIRATNQVYGPAAQFVSKKFHEPGTRTRTTLSMITGQGFGVPAHPGAAELLANAAYTARERLALALIATKRLQDAEDAAEQAEFVRDLEESARAGCYRAVQTLVEAYEGRSSIAADPAKAAQWVKFGVGRGWTWLERRDGLEDGSR